MKYKSYSLEYRINSLKLKYLSIHDRLPFIEEQVEFTDGFPRPEIFSKEYVHYFAVLRTVISMDDLNHIELMSRHESFLSNLEAFQSAFEYLIQMLESRIFWTGLNRKFNLISLGDDCLPRSISTKFGLKKPRLHGEGTMPFDLAKHPPKAVADILESGFADYLESVRVVFDEARNYPIDSGRGIQWNHERGLEWVENDFSKFRATYLRRIENFKHTLNDGRPTLCVMCIIDNFIEDASEVTSRIANILSQMATNRIVFLVILSHLPGELSGGIQKQWDEEINGISVRFRRIELPKQNYIWWQPEDFVSTEGLNFDTEILDYMTQAILFMERSGS